MSLSDPRYRRARLAAHDDAVQLHAAMTTLARNLAVAAGLYLSRDLGTSYGYPDEPGWDWHPGCGRAAPSTTTKGGE